MSTAVKTWTEWLENSRFQYLNQEQKEQTMRWLFSVRDKVLARAKLKPDDVLIDIGTGTGLLSFGAYDFLKDSGKVIASDAFEDCVEECKKVAAACGLNENFQFLVSSAEDIHLADNSVDVVVMRSVLVHILDKSKAIKEFYRILKPGGRISIFEPIIRSNTRYYELINPANFPNYQKLKDIEAEFMSADNDPLTNFDDKTLIKNFEEAGFMSIDLDLTTEQSTYQVSEGAVEPWFNTPPGPGSPSMSERFLKYITQDELDEFIQGVKRDLEGKVITVKSYSAYISASK